MLIIKTLPLCIGANFVYPDFNYGYSPYLSQFPFVTGYNRLQTDLASNIPRLPQAKQIH